MDLATATATNADNEDTTVEQGPEARSNFHRLAWFMLGMIVVAGVLGKLGGWALPTVLAGIITVVAGHELGHYMVAKRSGMKVTDFFVGFGPVIWSIDRGGTRYGVRAFLMGGYVKVPGMTWEDKVAPELESQTYRAATWGRKATFALAGPVMNGVMALVLAWTALVFVGWPSPSHLEVGSLAQWGSTATPAAKAHLEPGDLIVSIDKQPITSDQELSTIIRSHAGKAINLVVDRGGKTLHIVATPVDGRTVEVNGKPVVKGSSPVGLLGIEVQEEKIRASAIGGTGQAFSEVGGVATASVAGLGHVLSPAEFENLFREIFTPHSVSAATSASRPESVVGVVRIAVQGGDVGGWGVLLLILMSVNVFVGLFNLIPILPLDGGYVALSTYERLRSRRGVRHHTDMRKLVPVVYAFVSVLAILFLSTLYLDIVHPLANPFH
jgi:membrane-associated protease RseP (regulator of RpoE activity)